jgi:hypothetical protein
MGNRASGRFSEFRMMMRLQHCQTGDPRAFVCQCNADDASGLVVFWMPNKSPSCQ